MNTDFGNNEIYSVTHESNINAGVSVYVKDEDKIEQLTRDLAEANAELTKVQRQLDQATASARDFEGQLDQLKTDTGIRFLQDRIKELEAEIQRLQNTMSTARSQFINFASANNLFDGDSFSSWSSGVGQFINELGDQIERGVITVDDAKTRLKTEFSELFTSIGGGGTADPEVFQNIVACLHQVSQAVTDVQTKINSFLTDGIPISGTAGSSGGAGGSVADVLDQVNRATAGLSQEARAAYEPVTQLISSLVDFSKVPADGIYSVSKTLENLSSVMQGSIGVKTVENLKNLLTALRSISEQGNINLRFNAEGINELQNKRAALKNLAEYLPKIARIDTTKLEALSKINLTNFNNIKVSKASIESIAQLAESLKMLQDMPGLIEGIERKTSGGGLSNTPLALEGRASRLLNNAVKFQERNPGYDTIGLNLLVKDIEELRSLVRGLDSTNEQAITNASNRLKHLGVELDNVIADAEKLRLEQERATHNNADVNRQQLLSRVGLLGETDRLQNMLARIGGTTAQLNGGDQFEARLARYTARAKELGETITKTAANDEAELGRLRQAVERLMNNIVQLDTEVKGMQTQEKLAADVEKVSGGLTTLEGKLVTLKGTLSGMADSKPFMGQFESISAAIAQMKTLAENTDIGKPDQVRSLTTLYDALVQRVNEYTVAVRNGKLEDANTSNKEMQSLIAQLDWLDKIAKKRREIQHMYDVNDKVHGTATGAAMQQSIARLDALYNKLLQMDGLTTQQRQEVTRMFKEISIGATSAKQSMEQLGQTGQTMLSKFKAGLQKFGGWTIVTRALTAVIRLARQLVTNVKEIDTAMGQLRIVTGATASEMNKFSKEIAETSKKIGASITDLTDSATVYARLGYTLEESNTLAKYTSMLSKVGDIDVSDAQSAVTAITKAFTDIDINNIEDVMNKLVKTGKESCPAA